MYLYRVPDKWLVRFEMPPRGPDLEVCALCPGSTDGHACQYMGEVAVIEGINTYYEKCADLFDGTVLG
jgi:hypothetical protein